MVKARHQALPVSMGEGAPRRVGCHFRSTARHVQGDGTQTVDAGGRRPFCQRAAFYARGLRPVSSLVLSRGSLPIPQAS